ncbi:hypothetical protein PPACK8108_LOCUS11182 [Phakopsora pachyrhizi]|uniref:Uncharacterized protein n=1 Tax=Phakopsora pachyrhizi TaxID=170000 RepID=A0AAV0B1J8_PHAPC|nr:hypothetical protein PPACK8108_LOCUS11182 [Phakopsora pachyrhizi]
MCNITWTNWTKYAASWSFSPKPSNLKADCSLSQPSVLVNYSSSNSLQGQLLLNCSLEKFFLQAKDSIDSREWDLVVIGTIQRSNWFGCKPKNWESPGAFGGLLHPHNPSTFTEQLQDPSKCLRQSTPSTDSKESTTFKTSPLRRLIINRFKHPVALTIVQFGLVAIRFYNKTLLASWSCMQLNDYGNVQTCWKFGNDNWFKFVGIALPQAEPPGSFQMTLKSSQPFSSFDNNSKHPYKNYTGPFE